MHSVRGLFTREIKSIRLIFVVFTIFLTLMMGITENRLFDIKRSIESENYVRISDENGIEQFYYRAFMGNILMDCVEDIQFPLIMIFCIMAVFVVTMLFYGDKELRSGEFIASLPVSRNRIFLIKACAAFLAQVALALVYIIEMLILKAINISWISTLNKVFDNYELIMRNQNIWHIAASVLPFMTLGILVSAMVILFQTLITRATVATVVAGVMMVAPFTIMEAFNTLTGGSIRVFGMIKIEEMLSLPYTINLSDFGYVGLENDENRLSILVFPENFMLKMAMFLAAGVIVALLSVLINRKYELSMKGKITWSKPVRYILEFVIGAVFSVLILSLNNTSNLSVPATVVVMGLVAVVFMVAFDILLKRYEK